MFPAQYWRIIGERDRWSSRTKRKIYENEPRRPRRHRSTEKKNSLPFLLCVSVPLWLSFLAENDDDCGDGVEFIAEAGAGRGGVQPRGENHAGYSGHQTAERVNSDLDAMDVD